MFVIQHKEPGIFNSDLLINVVVSVNSISFVAVPQTQRKIYCPSNSTHVTAAGSEKVGRSNGSPSYSLAVDKLLDGAMMVSA
jgi:hypothetical protein